MQEARQKHGEGGQDRRFQLVQWSGYLALTQEARVQFPDWKYFFAADLLREWWIYLMLLVPDRLG